MIFNRTFFRIVLILLAINNTGYSQIYLNENFETKFPEDWNEYVNMEFQWDTLDGGYSADGQYDTRHPNSAKQGERNAFFHVISEDQPSTILTLPAADLEFAIKPDLNFFHAQDEWLGQDVLEVLYKSGENKPWVSLAYYDNETPNNTWIERNIQIPDSALTDSCIIGFKATSNRGYGVCIDSVSIIERGEESRALDTITFNQNFDKSVISESGDNPILRIGFVVTGNTDTLALDSIGLQSLNTNDDDVQKNGVNLYFTEEPFFTNEYKVDSNVTITNGEIIFDNLDFPLPTGYSYLWVAFDIDSDSTHNIHQNTLDVFIEQNAIQVAGSAYPSQDVYPAGDREIEEAIYYDDFETDQGWTLTGEFELDKPQGLGGQRGEPDPTEALIGTNVLGTDLTGLGTYPGDYEESMTKDQDAAVTKTINCNYYRDINLTFNRWLNVEVLDNDTASLYYSIDDGNTWNVFWYNRTSGSITEIDWNLVSYELPEEVEYQPELKIKIAIGPTNSGDRQFSGWNIDKFAITGNYIATDLSVTEITQPVDGCGHSSEDTIVARIENTGADTVFAPIPLICSPDGGTTLIRDTLYTNLIPGEDTLYRFRQTVDLSEPNLYDQFFVQTDLLEDEYRDNDTLYKNIYAPPTYKLPYSYDFEDNENDFWESNGTNSSWEWGLSTTAGLTITPENTEDNYWVTNLDGNFNNDENSFVSSPCFDFQDMDFPVIELRIFSDGNTAEDGAHVQYSVDGGVSWNHVDTLFYGASYNWDWYNNLDTIEGINAPGWDESNSGWYNVRTFLPSEITNKKDVKFRIHFGSNSTGNAKEGFAFDDIYIFNAPDDVGVDSILAPFSRCEPSGTVFPEISIKNYGLDSIDAGDSIPVGIDIEFAGKASISEFDTVVLSQALPPDSTLSFTFGKTLSLDSAGKFALTAYTLMEEYPEFYNLPESNDTATKLVEIYGYPEANLGPDIWTVQPDTLVLQTPSDPAHHSYLWQDGSTNSTFDVSVADTFHVEVTRDTSGCIARDTLVVNQLIRDIGIDSVFAPVSDCELSNAVFPEARFMNFGTDTIQPGDTLMFGAQTNGQQIEDTLEMSETIYPGEQYRHTFQKSLDLSVLDTTYDLKVYTRFPYDTQTNNDTLTVSVTSYGYPDFSLNTDTLVEALSYDIEAETGYPLYEWEYGDENSSVFTVTDSLYQATNDQWYAVTVTDNNGCSATDSAHVKLWIHDMRVSQKITPLSDCELPEESPVEVEIQNSGTDTVFTGTDVYVGFDLAGTQVQQDTLQLTQDLLPGNTLTHQFDSLVDLSAFGDYLFDFYTLQPNDMRTENDTLQDTTSAFGYPEITLGPDTNVAALSYTLDPGDFASYEWHDGSTGRYFTVEEGAETASNYYSVTVTDIHGCVSTDSVKVILAITDAKPVSLIRPEAACSFPEPVEVEISVQNLSNFTFESGEQIPVGYQVHGQEVLDTITLDSEVAPEGTVQFTFDTKATLTGAGFHTFNIFSSFSGDLKPENDTITQNVEAYGAPDVDIGPDTVKLEEDDFPYFLDAGDFDSYEWHNGSHKRTHQANEPGTYWVIVTDDYGCVGGDTIEIVLDSSSVGIGDEILSGENYTIAVYPVPARERLNVDIKSSRLQRFRLILINMNGQMVYTNQVRTREGIYEIETNALPKGVYYLRIETKAGINSRQIIIQ